MTYKSPFSNCLEGYTFDDMLLVPDYSDIVSRKDVSLSQNILGMELDTPIMPANMSTICESKMANEVSRLGGTASIHRFLSPEKYIEEYLAIGSKTEDRGLRDRIGITIGLDISWTTSVIDQILELDEVYVPRYVVIDVAHGHHQSVLDSILFLRDYYPEIFEPNEGIPIIVGNIASYKAVKYFLDAARSNRKFKISGLKIGIGGGSTCTTRKVTGCGFPQLSAIRSISSYMREEENVSKEECIIIADGGIKNSGDIVKALAAGADLVMCGNLFAGHEETPGETRLTKDGLVKKYAGMASSEEHRKFFGKDFRAPEGESFTVKYMGEIEDTIKRLNWGIRSGASYFGCLNLDELREYGTFDDSWVKVTNSGIIESEAHFGKK